MLTTLRRLAGTWFAKALFGLLILSFGIWGIEDVVRNLGRDDAVARVGGEAIDLADARDAARRELSRLQRQLGSRFEATEGIREMVARQAVDALVTERVLRQEAGRMGVAATPEAIRDYVFAIPAFQADGRFDRRLLDRFLRGNGVDEAAFLRLVGSELQRQQLSAAVRAGSAAPDAMARPLLSWARERRTADVVLLPLAEAPEPPAPTEAQLDRFRENNPTSFSSPEYRTATVARLAAETVAPEIAVSDAEIARSYEEQRDRFAAPERRVLEQLLLPDQAAAASFAEAWAAGATFEALAARARGAGGQATELGALDRAGLPIPELAEPVFSAAAGGVTAPVQSPFGWHVIRVARIEPPGVRTLDEVREELRREIAQTRAADLAYERVNAAEDALAGGAPLAEVAEQSRLRAGTVTTDAAGRDRSGTAVALPVPDYARAETLAAIFAARTGQPARMAESAAGAGFVAVELREVSPPALRPLAAVADAVRAAWETEARVRAQEERATALMTAARGGAGLARAAEAAGLGADRLGPFGRDPREGSPVPGPPGALLPGLFAAKPNDLTMSRVADGFAVAQLLSVEADPGTDPSALAAIRGVIEESIQDELETQYVAALRARADVRINQNLLSQVTAR